MIGPVCDFFSCLAPSVIRDRSNKMATGTQLELTIVGLLPDETFHAAKSCAQVIFPLVNIRNHFKIQYWCNFKLVWARSTYEIYIEFEARP